ncbi:MarR family winged helix-turn-helix transcriptional regulator [Streptomyces bauhiniae]|uniref:MarR family winged helix-turn-helix transcriptional regulator n=1 Tax=Streptomyces bauhiniae TaxID=2340725 RepID=UPI0035E0AA54
MESTARSRKNTAQPSTDGRAEEEHADESADQQLLDSWQTVAEGFRATEEALVSQLAEQFKLGRGVADVTLRLLSAPDYRMPMTSLAHELGMSSGGFTKLADRLCGAGLARRVACDADRRVTYLELTDHGEDTAEAVSQAATQILRSRVLTPLGREGFDRLAHTMGELRDSG